jgi:adenylyl cyclase-associated protein
MTSSTIGIPSTSNSTDLSSAPQTSSLGPPQTNIVPPAAPSPPPLPPVVEAFDVLLNQEVQKFADLSNKIGGVVAEQVGHQ